MNTFAVQLFVGTLLVAVVIAYVSGLRSGKRVGFENGLRYAPLELRRLGLEKGVCILCGQTGTPSPPEEGEEGGEFLLDKAETCSYDQTNWRELS